MNPDDDDKLMELGEGAGATPPPARNDAFDDLDDEDDRPSSEADDGDEGGSEEDREGTRERRRLQRQRAKERRREGEAKARALIESLRRQNQDLSGRLEALEKRTSGQDVAQLDAAITEASDKVKLLKAEMAKAIEVGDGAAVAELQEQYYEARKKLDNLDGVKKRVSDPRQSSPAIEPTIQHHAGEWMRRNSWFDPSGQDEDSAIARVIDQRLAAEGFDPRSPNYWAELDRRLTKRLPHRFSKAADDEEDDFEDDEAPPAPAAKPRPKPPTTGSSREKAPTRGNEYRLSADRVQALREAGLWDDPETRKKMIDRYREFDRQSAQRSR